MIDYIKSVSHDRDDLSDDFTSYTNDLKICFDKLLICTKAESSINDRSSIIIWNLENK